MTEITSQKFLVRSVQAFCYRYPLSTPVVTSFGRMLDRPAVFVRIEDDDGYAGWGEVWSNFPSVGAEHRARLVNEVLSPLISGFTVGHPAEVIEKLIGQTSVLALQSGEQGPFGQAIAGIDLAVWDLHARRNKLPLWKLLGGERRTIKVYASGINPTGSRQMAEASLKRGHRALKLKIGFDLAADRANLASLRELIDGGLLAADANQAWSLAGAKEAVPHLEEFALAWLEEPMRADLPWAYWQDLRRSVRVPLAAGENIASRAGFDQALGDDVLQVVQPDIAKWGGLSICSKIAREIRAAGKTFCPHYLGGGIGLLASAHLLAAAGGDGLLEIDSNDNPLRDRFCGPITRVLDGTVTLNEQPGLGFDPDLSSIETFRTI